jgi:hypothetical protein
MSERKKVRGVEIVLFRSFEMSRYESEETSSHRSLVGSSNRSVVNIDFASFRSPSGSSNMPLKHIGKQINVLFEQNIQTQTSFGRQLENIVSR